MKFWEYKVSDQFFPEWIESQQHPVVTPKSNRPQSASIYHFFRVFYPTAIYGTFILTDLNKLCVQDCSWHQCWLLLSVMCDNWHRVAHTNHLYLGLKSRTYSSNYNAASHCCHSCEHLNDTFVAFKNRHVGLMWTNEFMSLSDHLSSVPSTDRHHL